MSVKINGSGIITGLDADGISAQPVFPGNVLQVVMGTDNTPTSINSSSYVDTGLSATITPTSATSKILVLTKQSGFFQRDTNNLGGEALINLVRNSTEISFNFYRWRAGLASDSRLYAPFSDSFSFLDSPNSSSAITYKTQGRVTDTANFTRIVTQDSSSIATMVLMEIAA
jgi:hypothetical protein